MKQIAVIFAVLVLLGGVGAYYLYGMARGAKIIIVISRLTQASADLKRTGTFTNDVPKFCDIHAYTEHHSVGGTGYQCALAATSPLFRGSGFLAISTNDVLLWIDKERGAVQMSGKVALP